MGPGLGKGNFRQRMAEDNDIHATIHAAAFRGAVGRHRVILGKSGSAQTIGTEPIANNKEPHNFGCP